MIEIPKKPSFSFDTLENKADVLVTLIEINSNDRISTVIPKDLEKYTEVLDIWYKDVAIPWKRMVWNKWIQEISPYEESTKVKALIDFYCDGGLLDMINASKKCTRALCACTGECRKP